VLFSGTIKENIVYGVDFTGMTEEEKQERLTQAVS